MDDPWGDKATRAHLRPESFTWPFEPRTAEPDPDPEPVDIDAVLDGDTLDTDAIRTFMDDEPEVLPEDATPETTTVDSDVVTVDNTVTDESNDEPQLQGGSLRRDPAPDSISGRVWAMFKTFPKEHFHRTEIAATLDITNDQATSSVLHLQRLFLPIHGDRAGNYWYDEDQPVTEAIRKRAEWYAEYRKPKATQTKPMQKKSGSSKTVTSGRIASTAELLDEMGFHERGVIVFNALARFSGATGFGPHCRIRVATQQAFTPEEAALFPTNSIVSAVNRYLETIDSVTQGGPMKTLKQHPDDVPIEVREQATAALMTFYGVNRRLSPAAPQPRATLPTPVGEGSTPSRGDLERVEWEAAIEEPRSPERRPTMTDDLIDSVDEDRLAKALANGMWARYEWALTALGKAQEQLAGMQEAVRVRDQEIERLRGYLATQDQFSIKDVARDLLATDENGSR